GSAEPGSEGSAEDEAADSPPAPRKVRLAAIHHTPAGKSVEDNRAGYAPLIAEAARLKADLVVLGETITYVGTGKKPHEVAEAIPGPSTDFFGKLARKHGLHLVVGLYEKDGLAVFNVAVLIGPDGKVIGKYRKVCLPHSEIEAGVAPGDSCPVFDTRLGKVGLMVCYDGFFPEVARGLASKGAEVIAWPVWGCNPLLARARACENHAYVVSSTYSDPKSEWMFSGVIGHGGAALAKAEKKDSIAVAEVDLAERHFWRNNLGDFKAMVPRHRPPAEASR
ncbi:MAG: carbon-nitrogen hydrolase family protein, partial [Gemmataceae bacterium]|nr:carbon-nitrogen hydrolase family protein [Gemmataceae bacterium]